MLRVAMSEGVDMLDTAIAYGESELRLGEIGMRGFKVITKLPPVPNGCLDITAWAGQQLDASMIRLKVPSVYGLLLHRPEQLMDGSGAGLYEAMLALRDAGLVQKLGISIYSPRELHDLTRRFRFDLVQAPFNLVDRRIQTSGWLRKLKDEGVEIHTRSVFLQGLLLLRRNEIPEKFSAWSGIWNRWHDWLDHNSISPISACLALPHSTPEIDRVVVGADSVVQLKQILTATKSMDILQLPDLNCDAEHLINPSFWSQL